MQLTSFPFSFSSSTFWELEIDDEKIPSCKKGILDLRQCNDLTTETPELVAARYESLLRLLENKIRPRRIIILSLVYRKDVQKWKVDKLNVSLKQFQSNIVHFWKLDRVGGDNNIGPDGIHLNERGMMNFKRNIIYSLKCTK
ncbi:hypothetical protein HELRODRAFT_165374 [Helobdella robusta]|uniref:SGNH hydrolase-type esterase domain-containing protein n=1 Tax=Helobdella robusta TaxID=6412 RepID=T1EWN9_HELRO|nr:hypothetical protein HELRODRAFT_165374 [Helobdella robusta]ESN91351.1 hypothetical protein HELRODRAFT_165374 [Helobdella robusta]